MIRIGGATGYWGEADMALPQFLAEGDLDYIVFDYLAEITMSIMQTQKDPNAGDEMAVKKNNDCAESYDILTAQSFVRRPPGGHTATCIPAWF